MTGLPCAPIADLLALRYPGARREAVNPAVFQGSLPYADRADARAPVVTVGNFDGVHRGHQALLSRVVERARAEGGPSAVFTFDPPPVEVLRPDKAPGRLQSLDEKIRCLGEVGIDQVVVEPFDREYARHEARWFAEEVLGRRLGARALVLGWDFRFGKDRSGGLEDLRHWLSVPVEQFDPVELAGAPLSSSRIREAISRGDVARAADMLGRPFALSGRVVRGDQRGRTIGFPTVNIATAPNRLLPANGVYAVRARILPGGPALPAVANLGVRPTFDGVTPRPLLEVHLLDWQGDLYGAELEVELVERIREERRFPGIDALVAQIRADAARAAELLSA
jgi:riboflavin kinase/FMN adenylyltransferase